MKFVVVFLVAVLVFILLKGSKLGLKRLASLYPGWNFRINMHAVFEFIIWLAFIFWAADHLFRESFFFKYLVIALIFLVILLLSWFLIGDVVSGIIFKMKYNFKNGTYIKTGEISGVIKSQQITYLKLRTEDGQILRIPYSRINQQVISEMTHTETLAEHTIHLQISTKLNKTEVEILIRDSVLNIPWSNLKEEPAIKFLKETENGFLIEIMLFSTNPKHLKLIEVALEKNPDINLVS
ncbi:MAG TPA: mechanosensitive ion channel domain-containing protein [Bacteroidales bacterium]